MVFTDELVGLIPCNTPGDGVCGASGFQASNPIAFMYNGHAVTSISWTDTFNGTSEGIPAFSNVDLVDPGSGTGGIVLAGTPVPEVSTWAMMLLGFVGLGLASYSASRRTVASAV